MTNTFDWDSAEPGERNRWVAVNVMGWQWWTYPRELPQNWKAYIQRREPYDGKNKIVVQVRIMLPPGSPSDKTREAWGYYVSKHGGTFGLATGDEILNPILGTGDAMSLPIMPQYTTNATDDYRVLERVREAWDLMQQYAFERHLKQNFYRNQWGELTSEELACESYRRASPIHYRPGDYSAAAYSTLTETLE